MKCDDRMLLELLNDIDVADEAPAAQHISSCERCQQRLAQLAADQDSWNEIGAALSETTTSSSVVIAVDPELASDIPLQADRVSLDFLDEPSHPEMLGRIGRYDVERLIGAGGMGIVFKAFDTELHRPVAVKVLAPHLAHNGGARQRFAREAQSAAAVVHENVVPIHNVDAAGKLPFLVMQYVAGESLQARVDKSGPLSTGEVLRIGAQIAKGLAAAHDQGLVHRDVKPGNVLLEDGVDRVLISDFGLARAADDASVTRSGVIAGTPHYMSPEQAKGKSVDTRSDLFGLGSVLYFMCTAHPPFRADGAMAVLHRICQDSHRPVDESNEQIPADLANLIDQLLEKAPAARPANARAVAKQLMNQLHDARSRHRFRQREKKPSRITVMLATCCAICVIAIVVWRTLPPTIVRTQTNEGRAENNLLLQPDEGVPVREIEPQGFTSIAREPDPDRSDNASLARELDVFHDDSFFVQIEQLQAEAATLEWSEQPRSSLPLQDEAWSVELELTNEFLHAMEQGADEILLPEITFPTVEAAP